MLDQKCSMKSEAYPLTHNDKYCYFEFVSESEIKTIRKVVVYSPMNSDPNRYNLFLAHVLPDGKWCDKTVSNNLDTQKVIATVIQTMFLFLYAHENKSIYFIGSTPSRTRLYRGIIAREFLEAQKYFDIYGVTESSQELFRPNVYYKAYEIHLKHAYEQTNR
jgi:hypothetical protein